MSKPSQALCLYARPHFPPMSLLAVALSPSSPPPVLPRSLLRIGPFFLNRLRKLPFSYLSIARPPALFFSFFDQDRTPEKGYSCLINTEPPCEPPPKLLSLFFFPSKEFNTPGSRRPLPPFFAEPSGLLQYWFPRSDFRCRKSFPYLPLFCVEPKAMCPRNEMLDFFLFFALDTFDFPTASPLAIPSEQSLPKPQEPESVSLVDPRPQEPLSFQFGLSGRRSTSPCPRLPMLPFFFWTLPKVFFLRGPPAGLEVWP